MTTSRPEDTTRRSRTEVALGGWFWMMFGGAAQGAVTIGVVAVLARLLTPTDFGAVAAALLVINFAMILCQALVRPALVQHPSLRREHEETALVISLTTGVALFGLLWALAPFLAGVMDVGHLTPILRVLAVVLPIQALGAVAEGLLRRELRFRTVATIRAVSYTAGYGLVGITSAVMGAGLWALVAASASQIALNTSLLVLLRRHSWRIRPDRQALRELLSFGGGFFLGRLGNYAAVNGDYAVVVGALGATALGLYERAYKLTAMPAVFLGQIMDDVLFPAMAQIQQERKRLALAYRRCVAGVGLLTLPVSGLLLVLAPEIVAVLLGSQWGEVVAPFRILAFGTLFRASYKIADALTRALGAVYRRAWRQWTYAALVIGGGLIGQRWGLNGVAVAVLLALAVNFVMTAHLGTQLVALPWREYVGAYRPGLMAAAIVTAAAQTAATLARTVLGLHGVGVLALTAAGVAIVILPIALWQRAWLLGDDGDWLAQGLTGFFRRKLAKFEPHLPGFARRAARP